MLADINNPKNRSAKSSLTSYLPSIEKLQHTILLLYQIDKPDEINSLTALLIEQLANSLELISIPTAVNNIPLTCFPSFPLDFPNNMEMPLYLYGDRVFHELIENYAIVIGRFCAFERIEQQWRWKYLILSSQDSMANFFSSHVCWETELQTEELR